MNDRDAVIAALRTRNAKLEQRNAELEQRNAKLEQRNAELEQRNRVLSDTLSRFLSDAIVRRLLDTPDGLRLGGSKQNLTIMMSDLRGFSALAERMSAERLIMMLNHYLERMTEYISRHNGTIIDLVGDGIMVVFGAPRPSPNHAEDAVAAALDMQCHMDEVNAWNEEHGFPEFKMGIGINTGDVVIGNIGCERHAKYGVVGSPVNLAERIEGYTEGGQILISASTRSMIGAELEIVSDEEVRPKGFSSAITLYDITGIGGEYCLFCDSVKAKVSRLDVPIPFTYRHAEAADSCMSGIMTALSDERAVIETQGGLSALDEIVIDMPAGTVRTARVIRPEKNGWLVHFYGSPVSS